MKHIARKRRHIRITKKMRGTAERPRLVVFRSKKHISLQLVDDQSHRVLMGCSTSSKEFKAGKLKSSDIAGAKALGNFFAQEAKKAGITKASFDRAGYRYHGRVKALSDGAREGGLIL